MNGYGKGNMLKIDLITIGSFKSKSIGVAFDVVREFAK